MKRLESEGWVRPLITDYDKGAATEFLKLSDSGEAALERWLVGRGTEPERMAVYIGLEPDEAGDLAAVASAVFGDEWFALIEPGTGTGQVNPELAFSVVAADEDEAIARAGERMRQLREVAGLDQRPVLITLIVPAGQMDFVRWHRAERSRARLRAASAE